MAIPPPPAAVDPDDKIYMGVAYNATFATLAATEATLAAELRALAASSTEPSQAVMLDIQYRMQVFTFFAEFASSFEKKIAEMFQSMLRNL